MTLELSLGENQFVWALVHPLGKNFIKSSGEPGYQEVNLIISQSSPKPVIVDLEIYPEWAKKQILSGIRSGQLVNTGDKIEAPVKAVVETVTQVEETTEAKSKTTQKRKNNSKKTA